MGLALLAIPVVLVAAGAAAYEALKSGKKPPIQPDHKTGGYTEQNVRPPANVPLPPPAQPGQSPVSNPTSPAANAVANLTNPLPSYPPNQPPLPVVPSTAATTPPGTPGVVSTKSTGQLGALTVRPGPSGTGIVAHGDPGKGGGFDHGQTISIMGGANNGWYPVSGRSRDGVDITGFAWAGYITPKGGTAGISGEAPGVGQAYSIHKKNLHGKKLSNRGLG